MMFAPGTPPEVMKRETEKWLQSQKAGTPRAVKAVAQPTPREIPAAKATLADHKAKLERMRAQARTARASKKPEKLSPTPTPKPAAPKGGAPGMPVMAKGGAVKKKTAAKKTTAKKNTYNKFYGK